MKIATKRFAFFIVLSILLVVMPLQSALGAGARHAPGAVNDLLPPPPPGVDAHMTDGVTIIIHGWNPSGSAPLWLASLQTDISDNFLGGEQNFGKITVTKSGPSLVATCDPWNIDLTAKTTGGIVIVLDWTAVANHLTGGPSSQDVAAVVVDKIVTGQNGQKPLAELPIHLIGHSRGGGLAAELARLLGERGVVVDQLTLLDPHPLTFSDPQPTFPLPPVIDTPLAVYENVLFADNYWQNAETPTGKSVSGAYHRLWGSMAGGYYNTPSPVFPNHRNIYLMYQGTVDLSNPVNNGEASMDTTERGAWFNTYEDSGDDTGFTYSRLDGGGDRTSSVIPVSGGEAIRSGLNNDPAFGGSGVRSSLSWGSAVWPNVALLDLLSDGRRLGAGPYSVAIGATIQLHNVYLDYDSGGTLTLYADADHNPYNGNNLATISAQSFPIATGDKYTQITVDWNTSTMSNGTTAYVYAEVTDGTRTRYLYAAPGLQFQTNSAPTDISLSPGTLAENKPSGTVVGTLSTTDPDAVDNHVYTLACAAPGADDSSFTITGESLKTAASFNYEVKKSYTICVRTTDSGGLFFDKNLTISVTDVNEQTAKNGGFNLYPAGKKIPTYWVAANFGTNDGKDTTVKKEGTASVKILGAAGKIKTLTQTLTLSGPYGDSFTFSYYVKANAFPVAGTCQAQVLFYNGPTLKGTKTLACPAGAAYTWKKANLNFTAPAAYTKVVIKFTYSKSSGTVWFDLVSLVH